MIAAMTKRRSDEPGKAARDGEASASTVRVAVHMNVASKGGRDIVAGILRYVRHHPEWEIEMHGNAPGNDGFSDGLRSKPVGLISGKPVSHLMGFVDRDPLEEKRFAASRILAPRSGLKAAVFITRRPFIPVRIPSSVVDVDHALIGETAARLFLRHGLAHFAFIGMPVETDNQRPRLMPFVQVIRSHGGEVSVYEPPRGRLGKRSWKEERTALSAWLKALPKPCGVFAVSDQRAMHVLEICRADGILVPQELQVLGVDDEEFICDFTTPSLSSIAPDYIAVGYEAAGELARLLAGGAPHEEGMFVGVPGVTERLSTTDLSQTGSRVTRAMDFIRVHAARGTSIHEVARAVGGSERLLERDFRTVLGTTVCRAIRDARLDRVARLLRETDLTLQQIATKTGFSNAPYLKTAFRQRFGCTMMEWRVR